MPSKSTAAAAAASVAKAEPAETAPVEVMDEVERDLRADNLIKNHMMAASAASIVPLPLFDIAAITTVQVSMIRKLAAMFGKTFSESITRNVIASLAGGVVGHTAGITTAVSLTKLIPGVGWMLGMVSMPVIAGSTTYALGRVFLKHFKEGGTLLDISVDSVRGYFNEQVESGKKVAEAAKAEVHRRTAPAQDAA